MRTFLLVALGVLFVCAVAYAREIGVGPAYNATETATCEIKDGFDEYIYHAPLVTDIVADGSPNDWDKYPMIEWAMIDHWCEGTGQELWKVENGGWNYPIDGPEDFATKFIAAWGYVDDWPVLWILLDWIDDDIDFNPEGSWNTTDFFQYWYSEGFYDLDAPMSQADYNADCAWRRRQMNMYSVPGWGIRLNACTAAMHGEDASYCVDPNQEKSVGEFWQDASNHCWMEPQTQLFDDYCAGTPWIVLEGYTCLGLGISGANDFDPGDGTYSYITWGLSNRDPGTDVDFRWMHSTIGFEADYTTLFGVEPAVESTTWGAIKNAF